MSGDQVFVSWLLQVLGMVSPRLPDDPYLSALGLCSLGSGVVTDMIDLQ